MSDHARLRRIKLVARLREIEHRTAAAELFAHTGKARRARELAERIGVLSKGYAGRRDATDGHELAAQAAFARQVRSIDHEARAGVEEAERATELRRSLEMTARRRRDRAQDFADDLARSLREAEFTRGVHTTGAVGTVLDE